MQQCKEHPNCTIIFRPWKKNPDGTIVRPKRGKKVLALHIRTK